MNDLSEEETENMLRSKCTRGHPVSKKERRASLGEDFTNDTTILDIDSFAVHRPTVCFCATHVIRSAYLLMLSAEVLLI